MIRLKRTYEKPAKEDGYRILVDRLWPRGLSKSDAKIDLWLKDIAPTGDLRKWFSHDPAKWQSFRQRYKAQLVGSGDTLKEIRGLEKEKGAITLLYSAKDERHNDAVVLLEVLAAGR